MKNKFSLVSYCSFLLALTTILAISSCKKKFDEPFTFSSTGLVANTTIKELKALNPSNGQFIQIANEIIIKGRVTANDKSGNIYKMIYMQDETGAIALELDATGLYNQYPLGREIFVKAQGLYLVNEAGMLKLSLRGVINGTPSVTPIPSALIDRYIARGELKDPVAPTPVTLAQLNNISEYQSMLIQLDGFEVTNGDLNKTFADTSVNKATQNINLKDCSGGTIIVRTSGFANFAGVRVPQGRGTVTAIFTVFNTTKQLLVRDTTDLQMTQPRCGAANPNVVVKSIKEIRQLYTTGPATIPANTGIEGIIVSNTANEAAGNYRIQDAAGYGIQIRFITAANPNAVIGDKYLVDVSGLTVDLFNGEMQINNVASATKTGTGTVTPRPTTVAAINANLAGSVSDNWASTVVTLNNVSIAQTSTNTAGTNYTVTDATGSIVTFVRTGLGLTLPANASTLTGYVSLFNGTPQITLRQASDVVAGAPTTPVLSTTPVSAITQTTATSGGNITVQGASAVTARGVVWSTSPNPTIALSTKTTDGSGTGSFTSAITGLTASTVYYVRAYATNGSGTAYGNEVSFTTQNTSGGSNTTENFEGGAKTSYTAGTLVLATGTWTFSEALTAGTAGSDIFNGTQAARIRGAVGQNNGFIQTEFGITGLKTVKVSHAQTNFFEPAGAVASFELYISKDGGTTWTKVGNKVTSTKGTLNTETFTINAGATESVRIKILNTSDANAANHVRINIDDVVFTN